MTDLAKQWTDPDATTLGEAVRLAKIHALTCRAPHVVVARFEESELVFDVILRGSYNELRAKHGRWHGLVASVDSDGTAELAPSLTPLVLPP